MNSSSEGVSSRVNFIRHGLCDRASVCLNFCNRLQVLVYQYVTISVLSEFLTSYEELDLTLMPLRDLHMFLHDKYSNSSNLSVLDNQ